MSLESDINILKHDVIRELFLKTADQTYVVARWCFLNGLYLDFYWNAMHAVEKYLKAALLMNGRSSKESAAGRSYGHNIKLLYGAVSAFAGKIMPDRLTRPSDLNIAHWRDETAAEFVARLGREGDPNNRYNVFGFVQHPEDIYKLDMLVFAVRRSVQPLDALHYTNSTRAQGAPEVKNYEFAQRNPAYQPEHLNSKLTKLSGNKSTDAVREAFLNHNLAFAPDGFEHSALRNSRSADIPVLWHRIIEVAEGTSPIAMRPLTLSQNGL